MSVTEHPAESGAPEAFIELCGRPAFQSRVRQVSAKAPNNSLSGRATQQRHALELALARLAGGAVPNQADRRVTSLAAEAIRLADSLPRPSRARFRERLAAALAGDATLVPTFHLLRTASMLRDRGFEVTYPGLAEGTGYDLRLRRGGSTAVVACETVSAEDGRPLHRGDWCALVDRVNPELQTWLAAHPGRYLLKMTLPDGLSGADQLSELHTRICALLSAEKRHDSGAQAVLKLDPLVLAGAQASGQAVNGLPSRLRAQFGPEAHLAVTHCAGSGSVFVMAARAGRENEIAAAICRRLSLAAIDRLDDTEPGILAVFLEDIDRAEWRGLRERLELEGAVRRFLTTAEAKRVVAVSCSSRHELFGTPPPDGAAEGELRFRNPSHVHAKLPALAPAISSFA